MTSRARSPSGSQPAAVIAAPRAASWGLGDLAALRVSPQSSPGGACRRWICGGGAASRSRGWAARGWQRGMVDKAAGGAGQGILILAWLETRDQFNPFALRASEDSPVDVDRPT